MSSFFVDKKSIVSVYDGDTFKITVKADPPAIKYLSVRIVGIDAPEIKGGTEREKEAAINARDHLASILNKARRIHLTNVKNDKYGGRILARVFVDGVDVSRIMLRSGAARKYDGGKRKPWMRFRKIKLPSYRFEFRVIIHSMLALFICAILML